MTAKNTSVEECKAFTQFMTLSSTNELFQGQYWLNVSVKIMCSGQQWSSCLCLWTLLRDVKQSDVKVGATFPSEVPFLSVFAVCYMIGAVATLNYLSLDNDK